MTVELDTFLVALYTIVDELYQRHVAPQRPVRRGHRPEVSDSEVLTLMVCEQWHGRSERRFLRFVERYWRGYFPRLLSQSAFNRRARDLAGAMTALVPLVAAETGAVLPAYQVVDGVAMPLARRPDRPPLGRRVPRPPAQPQAGRAASWADRADLAA